MPRIMQGGWVYIMTNRNDDIRSAIQREKNLKEWPRAWKTRLIGRTNPEWHDLYGGLL
jgi:putative endonuclease